jgi:enolase-phosphatase E1
MKYILMDVEGTTSSISFVHEILFPFAKERLKTFIQKKFSKIEIQDILIQTKNTSQVETQAIINDDQACDLLIHWIETDRKHPALKALQGLIWEEGYTKGEIKGHVYQDVLPALKVWKEKGITLGVYSSGSVKAQHLIFEYSTEGNLRPYFSNHFDTGVGHKREMASYLNIVKQLNIASEEILFLSDIKEELDAARMARMKTIQLVRLDDVVLGNHQTVTSFSEIKL